METIGTCSICGGAVTVPLLWSGIVPPTPTCSRCGAVPACPHGPVIKMKRPQLRDAALLVELAEAMRAASASEEIKRVVSPDLLCKSSDSIAVDFTVGESWAI